MLTVFKRNAKETIFKRFYDYVTGFDRPEQTFKVLKAPVIAVAPVATGPIPKTAKDALQKACHLTERCFFDVFSILQALHNIYH